MTGESRTFAFESSTLICFKTYFGQLELLTLFRIISLSNTSAHALLTPDGGSAHSANTLNFVGRDFGSHLLASGKNCAFGIKRQRKKFSQ